MVFAPDRRRSPERSEPGGGAERRTLRSESVRLEMTNVPIDSVGETTCESVSVSACERETATCVCVCARVCVSGSDPM